MRRRKHQDQMIVRARWALAGVQEMVEDACFQAWKQVTAAVGSNACSCESGIGWCTGDAGRRMLPGLEGSYMPVNSDGSIQIR